MNVAHTTPKFMMSKLSVGRKVSSNKTKCWVEPSFGELLGGSDLSVLSTRKATNAREAKTGVQSSSTEGSIKQPLKRKASLYMCEPQDVFCKEPLQQSQDEPWVDKHCPLTQVDLAVHKKKTEEVENWLKLQMDCELQKMGSAILLLTGPSGCGKTATIHVLSQELGYQVQEWTNPSTVSDFKTEESFGQTFDPGSRFNSFSGGSQTAAFQEFLLRANKYRPLKMHDDVQTASRKLVLVEDFPNQFYRQPSCLHSILRRFVKTGRCPLIFIISDSLSGDSNSKLLFPKDIQNELGVCNICFNPVAPTNMMKVLNRILAQETRRSGGKIKVPDKAALELLCTGSSGDIRSAINSLQFFSLTDSNLGIQSSLSASKISKPAGVSSGRGTSKVKLKRKWPKGSEHMDCPQAIGGRDASLFLFRALGKILYCKREIRDDPGLPKLPSHLLEHHRDKLLVDAELVVQKSHMSAELFNLYLQQNYMDFFTDVEDVAQASKYLSDADFLTADWNLRPTMMEYSTSVATRGLMFSNSAWARADAHTSTGFRPFHKPHWLLVSKKHRENCQAAKSLFVNFCLNPVSLQTELLPYLAQLTNPMRNQAQIAFIQDVGRLPLKSFAGRLKFEALSDKDPGILDLDSDQDDSDFPASDASVAPAESFTELSAFPKDLTSPQDEMVDLPSSQPQPTSAQVLLEEEEIVIEEYDSD